MRYFIFAAALGGLFVATPAGAHDWYNGLRSPSGALCCNQRDCAQVEHRMTGAGEEVLVDGIWHPVEYDKVVRMHPPDGGVHACWWGSGENVRFRCFIMPPLV